MARIVEFADGAQSETVPTIGNIVASDLVQYTDDATYEANESGSPDRGNIYFNTTDNVIRYYNGTIWQELVDEMSVQAIENKVIDADNNIITNIENDNIKVAASIDAAKIANGTVTNAEFEYINTLSSNAQNQIDGKISTSEKGANNGVAELDGSGLVPSSQLPSYVDDVEEYADLASFPVNGAAGKIYIALDTNFIYRWTGATYVDITGKVDSVNGQTGAVDLGIDDLNDVDTSTVSPTDAQVLTWVGTNSVWEPKDVVAGAAKLDDLNDVVLTPEVDGDMMVYDGTDFVNISRDMVISSGSLSSGNPVAGQYGDLTSISLGGGTWEIKASVQLSNIAVISATEFRMGISTDSGNSFTDAISGVNFLQMTQFLTSSGSFHPNMSIVSYVVSPSSTTMYYLKHLFITSSSSIKSDYIITARRIK